VVVSYLPVGSDQTTEFCAEAALAAGYAFVNCIPVFIASTPIWRAHFQERGLPLTGNAIKNLVGSASCIVSSPICSASAG
jgi:myo-inositol-1-phosphate synthase